jgi:hypothetical protein
LFAKKFLIERKCKVTQWSEFLCTEKNWNKKEKIFAVNVEVHVTEFNKDEVSHAMVDKEVAVALVPCHAHPRARTARSKGIWAKTPLVLA